MSVAADPMLAAQASANRYGTESSRRCSQASISTGATARQTTSLLNTADSPATATIKAPSSSGGSIGKAASLRVTQA